MPLLTVDAALGHVPSAGPRVILGAFACTRVSVPLSRRGFLARNEV